MKYIIAVNVDYYPAVYEFNEEDEAKQKYDELVQKMRQRYSVGVPSHLIENQTIYFCEVKTFEGVQREN